MIDRPNKEICDMQVNKYLAVTFKKGIINRVYASSVDVQIVGSQQAIIKGIKLAKHIDITTLNVGDRCRLDMFDESNPSDMVVAYIY